LQHNAVVSHATLLASGNVVLWRKHFFCLSLQFMY